MSISTEKEKTASERFMLVRIEPRRLVSLTETSPGVYFTSFPYPVSKVVIDGLAELVKVSGTPQEGEFRYDESTGVLDIAYGDGSTPFDCVVSYYLFYTGTVFRALPEDPEDSLTPTRNWKPSIVNYPKVSEGFGNILAGVFSTDETSVELINDNYEFTEYLTDNDSFNNAQVIIWVCVNSVDHIQRIFTGVVSSLNMTAQTVTLRCVNSYKLLDQTASMGREDDIYIITADTPSVAPKDIGKYIPFVFGKDTYFTLAREDGEDHLVVSGNEAYCGSYSNNKSTSTNRDWVLCHSSSSVSTQVFGSLSSTWEFTWGSQALYWNDMSNVQIGDTIKIQHDNSGLKTRYYRVRRAGEFFKSPNLYNLLIDNATPGIVDYFEPSNFVQVFPLPSICVMITDGETFFYPVYERDYTLVEINYPTPVGTTKIIGISFVNNFEANIEDANWGIPAFPTPLDPDRHTVYWRATFPSMTHGQALKEMVNRAGIPDDGGFNTGANAALVAPVQFQIPNIDEGSPGLYRAYCQDILKGTIGYLRLNDSGQAQYLLAEDPASGSVRNPDLILNKSSGVRVDYQDIATSITTYNPHNQNQIETSSLTETPAMTAKSDKAKALHAVDNVNRFKHPFKYVDNIISRLIGIYSNRRAIYYFDTASKDLDTKLGDDIDLQSNVTIGSSTVKVTDINRSTSKTTIQATDLLGINE